MFHPWLNYFQFEIGIIFAIQLKFLFVSGVEVCPSYSPLRHQETGGYHRPGGLWRLHDEHRLRGHQLLHDPQPEPCGHCLPSDGGPEGEVLHHAVGGRQPRGQVELPEDSLSPREQHALPTWPRAAAGQTVSQRHESGRQRPQRLQLQQSSLLIPQNKAEGKYALLILRSVISVY